MTEPIKTKTIGGVTYNANQFRGQKLENGEFKLTAKKTGETITFKQQPEAIPAEANIAYGRSEYYYENGIRMRTIKPEVKLSVDDGLFYDDNNFTLTDIMGATFKSSKESVSKVTLDACQDTNVDLSANRSTLFGDYAKIDCGKNNQVILDDKDSASFLSLKKSSTVEGKGVADQKDYE